jgi:hypothetical protein
MKTRYDKVMEKKEQNILTPTKKLKNVNEDFLNI